VIGDRAGAEWWATYGKRPDNLFAGIQVCNTILTLGPKGKTHSTSHKIFTKKNRPSLFSTLELFESQRKNGEFPNRAGLAHKILSTVSTSSRQVGNPSGRRLFTLLTARYWYPVLPKAVPILELDLTPSSQAHSRLLTIELRDNEASEVALALLGGKISYLYWSATSNDMDSSGAFGEKVLGLLNGIIDSGDLLALARDVSLESRKHYFASKNAKKFYINLRWSSVRNATDKFDRKIIQLSGLADEWRNLNIWYRQTMRSSGENSNSVDLAHAEILNYETWYEANHLG
jgi:hypothetical protein